MAREGDGRDMKIVVIGGTGRIGSRLVAQLQEQGHEAVPASPRLGINTITGEGLDAALEGASVVVDVSNSPSLEPEPANEFFQASGRNLAAAEEAAGVGHHVALSIIGVEQLPENGYFRAKVAQEELIRASPIPFTIVHAGQFFEFLTGIADDATEGNEVRVSSALFQPMAADDVATALATIAVSPPTNGIVEIAGPEPFHMDELLRTVLAAEGDPRVVVTDPGARYFGGVLGERTLVPGEGAMLGETTFDDWQRATAAAKVGA
jgi:uncharacterized protein YbjT (DUF2867 family)